MVLHKIEDETLVEYTKISVSHELEMHDFIEKYPTVLEKNLFVIGSEVPTENGFIDILGLNNKGDTIIIEIKKDQTARKVIAQILEYAEWVSRSISSDELNKIAKKGKHLTNYPTLWKKYESEFNEIPDFNEHQRLYIVAEKIDLVTENLARYLRKNGIDIFCVELNFHEKNGDRFSDTKIIVGKEKAILPDTSDNANTNYDWNYYSERKGWDDTAISAMKKFVDDVIEFGKKESWELDVKFNQRYCAIQTKNKYNMCVIKERKGLIRIEFPPLTKKEEPPDSELHWRWSESQYCWQGNFLHNELVRVDNIKDVLRKSYNSRE